MTYHVQILGNRAKNLIEAVRGTGCDAQVIASADEISASSDICLAGGVYEILDGKYLSIPKKGVWGFHETALPQGRGCAPLQWTVLNGISVLTVSFFELTKKIDAGRLLGQEQTPIARTLLLEDLRLMALELSKKLIRRCLIDFLEGRIKPFEQTGPPSHYRRRTPDDSKLDTSLPLKDLWDLLRVCDNESFPAWFEIDGQKIVLKRYSDNQNTPNEAGL